MTASPILTPHHAAAGGYVTHAGSIPARRPARPFVPAPVQTTVKPAVESDPLTVADAVLELLRTVNRNATSV